MLILESLTPVSFRTGFVEEIHVETSEASPNCFEFNEYKISLIVFHILTNEKKKLLHKSHSSLFLCRLLTRRKSMATSSFRFTYKFSSKNLEYEVSLTSLPFLHRHHGLYSSTGFYG